MPAFSIDKPSMELLTQFIDIVLHLDKHLAILVQQYGLWIYGILFFIIFAETGFVIFPFLPGDSLLFVAGALAAIGEGGMNIWTLIGVLLAAAVLGNMVNYQIGRLLGPKVFHWENSRFFNKAALEKTHAFYEKHGGKTLVISRFLPLFRTFAPFVAGGKDTRLGWVGIRRVTRPWVADVSTTQRGVFKQTIGCTPKALFIVLFF
jgi:membrane-associated protein